MQVTLDILEQYLADELPEAFSKRIALYAALVMFQFGSLLSAGAADGFIESDRFALIYEYKKRNIPLVDFSQEDLHTTGSFWAIL